MDALAIGAGEGRLAQIKGRAGLGKTRACQWYAAHNTSVFLRVIGPMVDSPAAFLEQLCLKMNITGVPRRQNAMFNAIVDRLIDNPIPVFLDELERVRPKMLDLVRDLSDVSTAPFVLIGEEELDTVMRRNRRIWSRTFQAMDFEPVQPADIIVYLQGAAELKIDPKLASYMHQRSNGEWRLIKRAAQSLAHQANTNGQPEISKQMVTNAFAVSLGGG